MTMFSAHAYRLAALLLMILAVCGPALAQSPTPTPIPTPTPTATDTSPSPALEPAPSSSATPQPTQLFDLPAPVIPRQGVQWWKDPVPLKLSSGGGLSGETRGQHLLERLDQVAEQSKVAPTVVVDQSTGLTVVRAGSQALTTVLPQDLPEHYRNLPPAKLQEAERQLAELWVPILQKSLDSRVQWRSPTHRRLVFVLTGLLLVVTLIADAAVRWFAERFLSTPAWSLRALIWLVWLALSLGMVPPLHPLQVAVSHGILGPLWLIIFAVLGGGLLYRVSLTFLHGYFRALGRIQEKRKRLREQRLASLEGAATFALRLVIFLGGVVAVLSGLGVSLGHLVAGAGLLGAALTLVFQDLLRDITAGANILAEGQFDVGDWVETGPNQGTVEAFHLRATRLRNSDGTVTIVPNSELRVVKNHTLSWSQVDYRVVVEMGADPEKTLKILEEVASGLAADRPEEVTAAPEMLGIEALGPDGITLRLLLKTRPLQQWDVARELNRRVSLRFRKEGIGLAARRHALLVEDPIREDG